MDVKGRLTKLEARVAALEERPVFPEHVAESRAGAVGYQGDVRLDGHVQWGIRYDAGAVLALPAPMTVEVLVALGHPLRLAIVRSLLGGAATAAELQDRLPVQSSGKLYHHLRALVAARVVVSAEQAYSVPPNAVVPVLTLMLAAGDVAGLLTQPPAGSEGAGNARE